MEQPNILVCLFNFSPINYERSKKIFNKVKSTGVEVDALPADDPSNVDSYSPGGGEILGTTVALLNRPASILMAL